MIGFRINEEYLDLDPGTSISIEINNPLFNLDMERGTITYDFNAPATGHNRRLLQFAGNLNQRSRFRPQDCQLWIKGQLWRSGKLNILEFDKVYRLNFQTDAADLDTIAQDRLRDTDFTGVPVATFPVKNEGYSKDGGITQMNGSGPAVPFPYLVPVLSAVMARYGYTLKGSWLADVATQRRVVFNVVQQSGNIANHVPDITIGDFLKAIRKRYGLTLIFHTKTKELELVRLADALADTAYIDWTPLTERLHGWQPNTTDGFTLKDLVDGSDDLLKDTPESLLSYRYGNGADPIETGIGSTLMEGAVPVVSQKGGAAEDAPKFAFRVLQAMDGGTRGEAETWATLQAAHTDWLAWRSVTEPIKRTVSLGIPELLSLNPLRKVLVEAPEGTAKAFWQKIELSVSLKEGVKVAKVSFLKVLT